MELLAGYDPALAARRTQWLNTHTLVGGGTSIPAGHEAHARTWLCEYERWPELKQALADRAMRCAKRGNGRCLIAGRRWRMP